MNRRFFASLAAASALVILPGAAAQAYVAPGVDVEVTDSTPAPGESFQVIFEGATIGEDYTLTITSNPASIPSSDIIIAGTASLTKTATSDVVPFTVTLRSPASFALAITDSDGTLVASSTVVVAAPAAAAPGAGTGATGRGALATTGSDPLVLGLGAAGIIVVGAGIAYGVRRRQVAVNH